MKTRIKKLPDSQVELEIEISAQDFELFFDRAASSLGEKLEISGFRKGKAPREIVLKHIDPQVALSETIKLTIQEIYPKAIVQENLEPISQPKIDILKMARKNPFCFRASFFVLPDIKLPDYKSIASQIKRKKILVEQSDIDNALNWLQKSRPNFTVLKRASQDQDFVEIEFSSPQIKKGQWQKDAFILGRGYLIKGFEEQLIGMERGEEKKFSLLAGPDYFQKDLAGKKIDFSVKMKAVKKVDFPEINDEFAQTLGQFKNLNDLKENITKGLEKEKQWLETERVKNEILETIEKKCDFEVPKEFLDKFDGEGKKRAKKFLILREICKQENIQVSEQEVKDEVNKILKLYPDIGTAKNKIDLDKLKDYTKERMRNEKVLERLESFVK